MRIIGHRGAASLAPENTRTSYLRALQAGADGVECDVHLTKDGQVVCFHDFTLERTSDGAGPVSAHTLAQLRQLDVWSWQTATPSPPGELLTVAELIDLCQGEAARLQRRITLVIELKHPRAVAPGTPGWDLDLAVLRTLDEAGWDRATATLGPLDISLMSFDPSCCEHLVTQVGPGPVMILLAAPPGAEEISQDPDVREVARAWELARTGAVHGAGPGIAVVQAVPDAVAQLAARGSLVRVWTVDTPGQAATCAAVGASEITTNCPQLFVGGGGALC